MYIRFKNEFGRVEVRDVRRFDIRSADCEEGDGSTTHGAELYDLSFEIAGDFADMVVEYACGILLKGRAEVDAIRLRRRDTPVSVAKQYTDYCPDISGLAWFNSWEAAGRVMDALCQVLARGGQFFNLTIYGEDGEVTGDGWYW